MKYLITWIDKFSSTDGQYIANNKADALKYLKDQTYSEDLIECVLSDGEYVGKYDIVRMQKLKDLRK